jgi:acyl transferase domain-containing protein/acyl carrier protein
MEKRSALPAGERSVSRVPIAIVGVGCRFPGGASTPEEFWKNLVDGVDAIVDVPSDRWDVSRFYDPDPHAAGKIYARQGGFLREPIDTIDPGLFGLSPREAAVLDPQQRLLLEVLWEAFEDAGIDHGRLAGSRTGVFIGGFTLDHKITQLGVCAREAIFSNTATSSTMVMLSNRLSYTFDLRGPSVSVDTACSSSLVAAHLAFQSLEAGECDMAVVGGVNVMTRPEYSITMCKGGFLSPTSRCRAFDQSADGYVRGEGAGIILLKRLPDAEHSGDRIYALIRATGVNQDGKSAGITVPNPEAQQALVHEVLARSQLAARDIDVIEAHGTGTPAGDPVEAASLGTVLGQGREVPAWIGSVKTNIGHLEAGAGVAGLIKLALTLFHREVPPSLHFREPNQKIDFQSLGLRVPTSRSALPRDRDVHGVVNSFGYGGTNAHAILSSYSAATANESALVNSDDRTNLCQPVRLVPLSGHVEAALRDRATQLLADNCSEELIRVAPTLALRRPHLMHRAVLVGRSDADLHHALQSLASGIEDPAVITGRAQPDMRPVFVYTGMGAQWWGMGQDLFQAVSAFRRSVMACDEIWQSLGGDPVAPWFQGEYGGDARSGDAMEQPIFAQPANLILQVALTETWRSFGVSPAAIVGHSVGEIAAAYAAGSLSLEQVIEVVFHRSRLQQRLVGRGGMLAIGLGREESDELLRQYAGGVVIAADNSPGSVTLAGPHDLLADLALQLEHRRIFNRKLRVAVPYHSPLLDEVEDEYMAALGHLQSSTPTVPLYSSLLAERVTGPIQNADYWCRNASQRVLLNQTLKLMATDGWNCFIEVGPHPVLGAAILEVVGAERPRVTVLHSQKRGADNEVELCSQLGALYAGGTGIDWGALWEPGRPTRLPSYPFQREKLWYETPDAKLDRIGERGTPPLLQIRQSSPEPSWHSELGTATVPWLGDHRVENLVVFPAAGYIATAIDAADLLQRPTAIQSLRLNRALIVDGNVEFRVEVHGRELSFFSRKKSVDARWTLHARTDLVEEPRPISGEFDTVKFDTRKWIPIEPLAIYQGLHRRGLDYGPMFQGIRHVQSQGNVFEAQLSLPENAVDHDRWAVHPALLDAAFQAFLTTAAAGGDRPLIPVRIDEVRLHRRIRGPVIARGTVRLQTESALVGDLALFDAANECLLEIRGLRCQTVSGTGGNPEAEWLYLERWTPVSTPDSDASPDRWLCLTQQGSSSQLADVACAGLIQAGKDLSQRAVDMTNLPAILASSLETAVDGLILAYGASDEDNVGIQSCSLLLATFQLLQTAGRRPATIRILVPQACSVLEGDVPAIENAPLFGLSRVAQNELPGLSTIIVDAEPDADPDVLATVLMTTSAETEWAVRGGQAYVRRLERCPSDPIEETAPAGSPAVLQIQRPGALDSLKWLSCERRAPAAGEIELRVLAAPLNFKDFIKVMGFLPPSYLEATYYQDSLGLEAAGVVTRVGVGVTEWKVGDEVVTPARSGCLRSYVTETAQYVVRKPPHHGFAEAGCYINFVTAHYGLAEIGRLRAGESVLIHSAAGGVGLAALQVAAACGATVFATAGSEEKRESLRKLGLKYVYDSRTLAFADEILRETAGRGIDVVLNAQPGDMMRRNLDVLAPYGRFIEIGKRAVLDSESLNLSAFDKNLLFAAIDIDRMMADNPTLFRRLLDEVHARFCDRTYDTLPTTVYDAEHVETAFRELGRGQHIGKIAVRVSGAFPVQQASESRAAIRPDSCYLVTGGLGGFGQAVARWLVEQGARRLVLASRSGASNGDSRKFVAELEDLGISVLTPQIDISDRDAVFRLIQRLEDGPPLRGIFHAAAVLDDAPLSDLNTDRLARVMSPKAAGALWLDEATSDIPLDHFVLFSSVSAVTGNPGQGAYVAANSFLDSLAERRRATGKPAMSVNWGVISDVGMVARNSSVAAHLERLGIRGIRSQDALAALRQAMRIGRPRVGVFDMDWAAWTAASVESDQPRFSEVAVRAAAGVKHPLAEELSALDPSARLDYVRDRLCRRLSRVMQTPLEKIDVELGLDNMGVDSLMATELAVAVKADLHVELSTVLLMQGPSVTELGHHILKLILVESVEATGIDEMSEEELDAFLAAELSGPSKN